MAVHGIGDAAVFTAGCGLGGAGGRYGRGVGVRVLDVGVAVVAPAAALVDEARLVQAAYDEGAVLRAFAGLRALAFVVEHPHDDARHVVVGVDHGLQLVVKLHRVQGDVAAVGVGRGHVLPYHQAELVAPVVPPARLHLDVLAHHVEAVALHHHDVVGQCLVGRGGVDAVGPETLVERAHLEQVFVVQLHADESLVVFLHRDLAHAEVALHLVLLAAAVVHRDVQVVEERVVGAPQVGVRDGQRHVFAHLGLACGHHFLLVHHFHAEVRGQRGVAAGLHAHLHLALVHVGHDGQVVYVGVVHRLHPYRLPDAAHAGVHDAARRERLLAAGVAAVVRRVIYLHLQSVLSGAVHQCRNVEREGVVAAFVLAGLLAVHRHHALPVHGLEVQQHPLALGQPALGHGKRAAVAEVGIIFLDT